MEPKEQVRLIKENTVEIVQEKELLERIKKKSTLKIKFGVDPTTSDIHLGHSVVLSKLKCFQDLGHQVILLIGDFTARVGDPSGRIKTRKPLSVEQININAKTYKEQAFKILDSNKIKILYNSQWLGKMDFSQVLKLSSYYTVARMLERDDFSLRYKDNYPIGMHEFLYPLMQAYDSVALKCDVEIGGTDQKFNLLLGRQIQKSYGQPPQIIITMPILEGISGKEKMSKSLGNYIGISEPPHQIYGKIMSIPDELIFKYFRLLTPLGEDEIKKKEQALKKGRLHPVELKEDLAKRIVTLYYTEEIAKREALRFDQIFRKEGIPSDVSCYSVKSDELSGGKIWIVRLLQLAGLAKSGSEARRLIEQGGVRLDGEKINSVNLKVNLDDEHTLQVGKRKFLRVVKNGK